MGLEVSDEKKSSGSLGIKNNTGVKKTLGSQILISFLTNREYDWPENNLELIYGSEIVGEDISDPQELARLEKCKDCCVMGNIVFYNDRFKRLKSPDLELEMIIHAKPFPEIEQIPCVSEAMVALPSRLSDSYIKSRMGIEPNNSMGTFLLGLDLTPDFCTNMGYCEPAEVCNF